MSEEDRAQQQAVAQFNHIRDLVNGLNAGDDNCMDAIHASAIEVSVRGGWHEPGSEHKVGEHKASEYRILLCTGGPAVRITGQLSLHCEPDTASLEYQDWFTPWEGPYPANMATAGSAVPTSKSNTRTPSSFSGWAISTRPLTTMPSSSPGCATLS